jgi:hypothetical protein
MVRDPTHEIRVTGVLDGHDTDAVELSGGGTEVNVGAVVVVDRGLGPESGVSGGQRAHGHRRPCPKAHSQHGVVLELGLAERGAVLRDEDELGCGGQRLCG